MKSSKAFSIAGLVLMLILAVACGRQTGVPTEESSAAADPAKLPFDREPQSAGISPSHSLIPSVSRMPSGTPITIRLGSAVSSGSSHAGDTFEGALEEPIVIEGQTIAARGAAVTGRVLAAKPSGRLQDPGYIRIALVSLRVDGNPVAIETSSIFAKAGSHENRNLAMIGGGTGAGALMVGAGGGTATAAATGKKEIEFGTERRLTFRLAQPVELH